MFEPESSSGFENEHHARIEMAAGEFYETCPRCSTCGGHSMDLTPGGEDGWIYDVDGGWVCPRCYDPKHLWKCAGCGLHTVAELPEDNGWEWFDHRPMCCDCTKDRAAGKLRFTDYPRTIEDVAAKDHAIRFLESSMSNIKDRLVEANSQKENHRLTLAIMSITLALGKLDSARLKYHQHEHRTQRKPSPSIPNQLSA